MTDTIPFDLETEEALLGSIMLSRAAISVAADIGITAADFYKPRHASIWTAACTVHASGAHCDPVTLASALNGWIGDNAQAELMRIQAATPASANAHWYAATVRDRARRRSIMALAAELAEAARDGGDTAALIARATELATIDADTSRLVAGGSFVLDAPDRPTAIWGADNRIMWATQESLLICGPAGVGKTTLVIQLVAGRLGILDELLGLPITPAGKGLYLACDRPGQIQRAFARLFGPEHRALLDERLVIWRGPPAQDFGRNPQALLSMCRRAGADFVVIDSLKDVAIGLADDDVSAGLNSAIQLALAEGVDVVALHHQRKGQAGAKAKTLEDVYGSTWVTAGAGSVVLLWGQAGDPVIELIHLKQPATEVGPLQIDHDHDAGTTSVFRGDVDPLRILKRAADGITAVDLAVLAHGVDKPSDNQVKKTRRKLEWFVREGLAHRVDGARGGRGGTVPDRYYAVAREPDGAQLDLVAKEQHEAEQHRDLTS